MVSRAPGLPAYLQVAEQLRSRIRDGQFPQGSRLPTERELVETFQVSSKTIKAALDQLRNEGLIFSRQGVGVFVREQPTKRKVGADRSWRDILKRHGLKDASVVTVRREPCPPEVAEDLGIEAGTEVTVRDRLLRAEGEPPDILARSWHPDWVLELVPDLADPTKGGMIGMHERVGMQLHFFDVVSSRRPTPEEVARLELAPGDVVTDQRGVTYDQDDRPVYVVHHIAAGHRIEFTFAYR